MKVREILSINNFDPMEIDVGFLHDVTNEIPQEGYIDPAMAERLATLTLRAADKCVDLLGQSTLYVGHCDALRKSARSTAISTKIANNISATVAKEAYSDDEVYTQANNQYNIAFAWQTWLENKMDTLLKTHHLCKDIAKKDSYSTWQPADDDHRPKTRQPQPTTDVVPTRPVGKTTW